MRKLRLNARPAGFHLKWRSGIRKFFSVYRFSHAAIWLCKLLSQRGQHQIGRRSSLLELQSFTFVEVFVTNVADVMDIGRECSAFHDVNKSREPIPFCTFTLIMIDYKISDTEVGSKSNISYGRLLEVQQTPSKFW